LSATIAQEVVKAAVGTSRQASKEAGTLSVELFNFDFMSLTIKLFVWFLIAVVIDKIHFVISSSSVNVVATIVNAFGYNLPSTQSEPEFFKKLFGEGYFGLKYWDFVKIFAILLVFIEFMRYYENEKRNGGKPSAFTIGIFVLIMTLLTAFTIPEIIQKLRSRIPNNTGGV